MNVDDYFKDYYLETNGEIIPDEVAESVVRSMAVTDNSKRKDGQKYSRSEAEEIGNSLHIDWNQIPLSNWYVVLNGAYSDFYSVAKKNKLHNSSQFFSDLAFAWFNDVDAKENKTFRFFV